MRPDDKKHQPVVQHQHLEKSKKNTDQMLHNMVYRAYIRYLGLQHARVGDLALFPIHQIPEELLIVTGNCLSELC